MLRARCAARPAERRSVAVSLVRRGLGPQAYTGKVRSAPGARCSAGRSSRSAENADAGGVTVPLTKAGRKLLDELGTVRAQVIVETRGARGKPVVTADSADS